MKVLKFIALFLPALVTISAPKADPVSVRSPYHNFDVVDGQKYGYTAAISTDAMRAGESTHDIELISFAGRSNDGVYQILIWDNQEDGDIIAAAECSDPCNIIKYIEIDEQTGRGSARIIRPSKDTVIYLALRDAINGQLRQYYEYEGRKKYSYWVDSKSGLIRISQ